MRPGVRRRRAAWARGLGWGLAALGLGLLLGSPGGPPAPGLVAAAGAPEVVLEDLKYRVDAWIFKDAVQARIRLTRLGPGRYRAEMTGEARGLVALLTGQRRDRYATDMVLKEGRLLPLLYQEESRRRGKRALKKYRFDYEHGRLELWQGKGDQDLVRRWQTELKGAVYDPLSAFYNCRLGLLGPMREGDSLKLTGIPYPQPEEIVVRVGPLTPEGLKVMVTLVNRAFENERGQVFVYFNEDWAPTQAWTRVLMGGKIIGTLTPGSQPLKGRRLEPPSGTAWGPGAGRRGRVGGRPGVARPGKISPPLDPAQRMII